jgi:hypothetical protein
LKLKITINHSKMVGAGFWPKRGYKRRCMCVGRGDKVLEERIRCGMDALRSGRYASRWMTSCVNVETSCDRYESSCVRVETTW